MLRTKTLLGETFVELTPGDGQGPTLEEGGRLPEAQVAESVQLDEIWRTFDARTRDAFRVWMQGTAASLRGRGADLSAAIAELSPFAEETNRLLRVLDSQRLAVRKLVHDGGTVFQALSERQGQLRGLIQNSEAVFSTTARRNQELADLFRILPTFQRESRATLERLNRFAGTADPLVQQLRPAARELSPTLVAAAEGGARPEGVLRRAAGDDQRLGQRLPRAPQADQRRLHAAPGPARRLGRRPGPYLAHLNPIVEVLGMYKHEITAFLGNAAAATQFGIQSFEANGRFVKILRTTSPLNPESLASFDQRLNTNRANPYFKPLGYSQARGAAWRASPTRLAAPGSRPRCRPPPRWPATPTSSSTRPAFFPDPTDLYNRIKSYAFGDVSSTNTWPRPPCAKQGKFESIGRSPELSDYLHVRREP